MSPERALVTYFLLPDLSASTFSRVVMPFRSLKSLTPGAPELHLAATMAERYIDDGDLFVIPKIGHDNVLDFITELQARGKRYVFDLDYYPELPRHHVNANAVAMMRPYLDLILFNADLVTTPTARLAEALRVFTPDVAVVPDFVDLGVWTPDAPMSRREDLPEDAVVVAWGAPPGSDPDLEPAHRALRALVGHHPEVRVLHFGSQALRVPEHNQVRLEFDRYPRYRSMLDGVDIAIVPKTPSMFNDCASPRAALEYGAASIPVVASPTHPYRELADSGAPIMLADSPSDWESTLERLVSDAKLRRAEGSRIRAWVESERALEDHADAYEPLFVAGTGPGKTARGVPLPAIPDGESVASTGGIESLAHAHDGECCYIVGKGPSLQYLRPRHFPQAGPIITLNQAVLPVQDLGLPNKVYSMQKDGCGLPHTRDCNGCPGDRYPMAYPAPGVALLLHELESKRCLPDWEERYVFDSVGELGLPAWWYPSVTCAVQIARLMGCTSIELISHDACVSGDARVFVPGESAASMATSDLYRIQCRMLQAVVGDFPHRFVTPTPDGEGETGPASD